jgi:predicted RNA-binding protein YlxR (DUF448 family)
MRRRPVGVATGEALSRRPSVSVETGHTDAAGTPLRSAADAPSAAATPRRTCVVCRAAAAKRELHRIVRAPDGTVAYDPTGKAAGRGAYLCGRPDCLDTAVRRRSILRALKVRDAAAAEAAVEALRNRTTNVERVGGTAGHRSSDDKEVRSG